MSTGTADDLGLFGPGSVTWRVHAEPILALGGLRALYLQTVHPRAMAGVAQNSGYRSDPWGRLERTAIYVATVVYGTTAEARYAGDRLRALHARMSATDPDTGERFRIDEPDLLRWVHVTEIDSFLTIARRAGLALTDAEADRYVHEQRRAAELVGLAPDDVPGSVGEVADYYREVLPRLRMTREAAESLLFLSVPPMPWGLGYTPARAGWAGLAALAVGLLPPWARTLYGLPNLPGTDLTASLSTRALRLTLRTLPRRLFEGPIYRSAMARAALAANAAPAA
ncbi:oxygenase MpaB family protein [Planosporangium sp. 12N6]|uniref:oxygenase MpaB family protein n=1 Tax=Planosporangium spinosum TaxID=3402278 RepID=UPI003CEB6DF8